MRAAATSIVPPPAHGVYVFVLEGAAEIANTPLGRRDSIGIGGTDRLDIKTTAPATDLLVVETAI